MIESITIIRLMYSKLGFLVSLYLLLHSASSDACTPLVQSSIDEQNTYEIGISCTYLGFIDIQNKDNKEHT